MQSIRNNAWFLLSCTYFGGLFIFAIVFQVYLYVSDDLRGRHGSIDPRQSAYRASLLDLE